MPHRLVIRRWLKRTLIYGSALLGIYMAVYLWARLSGNLVECGWEIDTDETHTCWAPGGICNTPPPPVGIRKQMTFFRPANAIEAWLPDSMKECLNLKRGRGIRFTGQFTEGEAARYLRIVLQYVRPPPGAFLG